MAAPPCSHCHEHASYCSTCVNVALQPSREKRRAVWDQWRLAKEACEYQHTQPPTNTTTLQLLQTKSEQLRELLEHRRKLCSELSVRVCQLQVANEERAAATPQTNTTTVARNIDTLSYWIVDGLSDQLEETRTHIRQLRWQWALTVFSVYPIRVEDMHEKHAGIGKICGLPLPNAGSELLGVLPASECQSALRLTALVTQTIAHCLDISLPHPIRLRSENDHDGTKQRIQLASMAMIQESPQENTSIYALADSKTDEFQIAWQFLQNDIIALCIRAGVPVGKLVSGEAVLCNLRALQRHLHEKATMV